MNSPEDPPRRTLRAILLGGALLIAALGGATVTRLLSPTQPPSAQRQARPIVQIVRQQPGLPDLSDLIARLCPSAAMIVPHGSDVAADARPDAPAFAYSADGWLVTAAAGLPPMPADALFGDGRRIDLSEVRTDPVSGLGIAKAVDAAVMPLPFSDQAFPRVGQFGFALTTPSGTGCSAGVAMIGSDFLADGGGPFGYVRLQPLPEGWTAGVPLLGTDGRVVGIGASGPPGAVIPAPVASVILDELIRNSLSPSTDFGFRAIDYSEPFTTRLGSVRSRTGIALVQSRSAAAKAGLKAGDIVSAVNEVPVSSASELNRALDALSSTATLTIQRRSQQLRITVRRSLR